MKGSVVFVAATLAVAWAVGYVQGAGFGEELFKLPVSGDVDISGNIAIIGNSLDRLAYFFDATTGEELFELTSPNGQLFDDHFGYRVAIDGNVALVSAVWDRHAGLYSGAAYLFDATTRQLLHRLTASDAAAGDVFGDNLDISGNVAIVAAPDDDDLGTHSGAAYLFDVTTGQQLFKLTASEPFKLNESVLDVGVSGNIAIVGSLGASVEGVRSGAAYLFDATTGGELMKLAASDGVRDDYFGRAVAISGNRAVIGAWGDDDMGNESGLAYLFDVTTGQELFKLTASDAAENDSLGYAVDVSGNLAIVGARWKDANTGAAYLFDTNTGRELLKLTASDAFPGDQFGWSVAISGDFATVRSFSGVYVFSVELPLTGDMDCDGDVDFDDIDDFVLGLNDPVTYTCTFGVPPTLRGDTDWDGDHDFDDISGFVAILGATAANAPFGSVPEPPCGALVACGLFGLIALRLCLAR